MFQAEQSKGSRQEARSAQVVRRRPCGPNREKEEARGQQTLAWKLVFTLRPLGPGQPSESNATVGSVCDGQKRGDRPASPFGLAYITSHYESLATGKLSLTGWPRKVDFLHPGRRVT